MSFFSSVASRVLASAEQHLDTADPEIGVGGQGVDGAFDDLCLVGGEPPVVQGFGDWCQQRFAEGGGEADECWSGAFVAAGGRGEEVLGRGPPGGLDTAGGVELVHDAELHRVEGGFECLDLVDGVHQLGTAARRPQRVCQVLNLPAYLGQLSRNTTSVVVSRQGVRLGGHE